MVASGLLIDHLTTTDGAESFLWNAVMMVASKCFILHQLILQWTIFFSALDLKPIKKAQGPNRPLPNFQRLAALRARISFTSPQILVRTRPTKCGNTTTLAFLRFKQQLLTKNTLKFIRRLLLSINRMIHHLLSLFIS